VPSPDGSKPKGGSTRALGWDEYGRELASAAGIPVADGLNDTDALLAAYLSEDPGEAPASSGRREPPSSHGSSQGAGGVAADPSDARSFGLRWGGDRPSSHGVTPGPASTHPPSSTGSNVAGARASTTTGLGGFNSPGRHTTGARPLPERGSSSGDRASSHGERVSSGFGAAGRATTGNAGLRFGASRDPRSSQGEFDSNAGPSSSGMSPHPHHGTKLGVGSSADRAWGETKSAPPPADQGFSFEERPFDAVPASNARRAPQPLRGSMSHSSIPAVEQPPEQPAPAPSIRQAPSPAPAPVAAPLAEQDESAPTSLPVSRRGKAGSMNWGAPRRNDKK
jgi:hypothetical protein